MTEAGVVAEEAHDRKLLKSLVVCSERAFTLCHWPGRGWESTGGATDTVYETIRKWTDLEGARSEYPAYLISPQPLLSDLSESSEELGTSCD